MKKTTKQAIALSLIMAGVLVVLFPLLWIVYDQSQEAKLTQNYQQRIKAMSNTELKSCLADINTYNQTLNQAKAGYVDPFVQEVKEATNPMKKFGYQDVVATIELPKIGETLNVYWGADDGHLSMGAAIIEGTDFPVGKPGTRPVIAAHRGGWRFIAFYHLDQYDVGDEVILHVLDKTYVYRMVSSEFILPSEGEKILRIPGKDMLTLLTCDYYPRNWRRLIVNFERVLSQAEKQQLEAERKDGKTDLATNPTTAELNLDSQKLSGRVKAFKYGIWALIVLLILLLLWLVRKFWRLYRT